MSGARGRDGTSRSTASSSTTARRWSNSPVRERPSPRRRSGSSTCSEPPGDRTRASQRSARSSIGSSARSTEHQQSGSLDEIDVAAVSLRAYGDAGLNLDDDLLDEVLRIEQEAWWHGARVDPEAIPLLDSLRDRGIRVGLCSNAPYRVESLHEQLAFLGPGRATWMRSPSQLEVGWRKPSPRIFEAALRALGTGADRTVMVGDSEAADIAGAHAAGMRAVLIRRGGDCAAERSRRGDCRASRIAGCAAEHGHILGLSVEFKEYIKERCAERGISLHRLALLCDLNQIYFYQSVNKNKDNPPPWVLRRAAPHLAVPYMELMIRAGYVRESDIDEWRQHTGS